MAGGALREPEALTAMAEKAVRPETVQRITSAVFPAFALLGALELDLFSRFAAGPRSAAEIARETGWSADKLDRLLHALAASGLLLAQGEGRFSNTPEGERYLIRGRPDDLGEARLIFRDAWESCLKTAQSVRCAEAQAKHDFEAMDESELERFLRGLAPGAAASASALARQADFTRVKRIADVGGGSGALAAALCQRFEALRASVFELPAVVPVTRRLLAERDQTGRVEVRAADLANEPMPGPFDAAVLRNFLQIFDAAGAARALANVAAGVRPGGAIYVLGIGVLDDSRLAPAEAALFDLVFLNVYDGGRCYTEAEYRRFAEAAGLTGFARVTLEGGYGLITLRTPG